MINIAAFTGSRAEYGLMRTLLMNLQKDISFEFNLLVSGTHLNSKFEILLMKLRVMVF